MPDKNIEPFVIIPHKYIKLLEPIALQVLCVVSMYPPSYNVTSFTVARDLNKSRSYINSVLNKLVRLNIVRKSHSTKFKSICYKSVICNND